MHSSEGYLTTEDGVRLFYHKLGDGPRALIIPNGIYLYNDFKYLADSRTLIFYDVRNRGRSDSVTEASKLTRGIHHDVDDLEAVRRHFRASQVDVLGHSYIGLMVALFAMKYPASVNRVVQIGPMQPSSGKQYPAHLRCADGTLSRVLSKLAELQKERPSGDPEEDCKKFWAILGEIYVVDPADAEKINWGRCDLPNERNFRKYWSEFIGPSIESLDLSADEVAKAQAPVLIVHGIKDRSSPYGGGRDWALMLPNARLVTVENAAHAPWIEAPELVFEPIETFLGGKWPESAQKVDLLEPC